MLYLTHAHFRHAASGTKKEFLPLRVVLHVRSSWHSEYYVRGGIITEAVFNLVRLNTTSIQPAPPSPFQHFHHVSPSAFALYYRISLAARGATQNRAYETGSTP